MKELISALLLYAGLIALPYTYYLDREGQLLLDWQWAGVIAIIWGIGSILWMSLVRRTSKPNIHTILYIMVTWSVLLTIGDALIFQQGKNAIVVSCMLLFISIVIIRNRNNYVDRDGLMGVIYLLLLYLFIQIDLPVLPYAGAGIFWISLVIMIVAYFIQANITLNFARIFFWMITFFSFIFMRELLHLPIIYIQILLIIAVVVLLHKWPILLPKRLQLWVLVFFGFWLTLLIISYFID